MNKKIGSALALTLIFGLAFYLRQFTFWLPHWQGDQSQYVMLAMKLGEGGGLRFSNYNLSDINVETVKVGGVPYDEIIFPYHAAGRSNFIIDVYRRSGLQGYDMPFFYKAPMLPVVLTLSHRLFSGWDQPYAVVKSNLREKVLQSRPFILLKTQFWVAIVPFACSLLTLLILYFWTRSMFGGGAALIAAFIFATNPVTILTANRLWTEDLALLFLTTAMILYRKGFGSRNVPLCLASGVTLGLAVLTNQRSLLAVGILGFYTLVMALSERKPAARWVQIITDRRWWIFLAGVVGTTFGWFWTIHRHYGNPLWQPEIFTRMHQGREIATFGGQANLQEWYGLLLSQPHGFIYYPVGTAAICWMFAAGYLTLRDGLKSGRDAWAGRSFDERPLFLWCWILIFAAPFLTQRTAEYRYIFPVYPALAALSGWMLVRCAEFFSKFTAHRFIAYGVIILFMAVSAAHSVRLVFPVLWNEQNLITAPWR